MAGRRQTLALLWRGYGDPVVYDAENLDAAFLAMFRDAEDSLGTYDSLGGLVGTQEADLWAARDGDAAAARRLLTARQDYEDEGWEIVEIVRI